MKKIQLLNQEVDVADWQRHEESPQYPEGARDKTFLYCPSPAPYAFLKPGHLYIFKRSHPRYPEQFWVEIFAYRLGIQMGILIPPTFVAYDSKKHQSGALIEWFLKRNSNEQETFISGGDYCQQYFSGFDRKKGSQHNFQMIIKIFNDLQQYSKIKNDWKSFWASTLLFDALIGNRDRHQDNWGILKNGDVRISPVFDNGTSMGHEIFAKQFHLFEANNYIEHYVSKASKAKHHMKWSLDDNTSGHYELLKKFLDKYPETYTVMVNCLKNINDKTFKNILDNLVQFKILTQLSTEQASFMLRLLSFRYKRLLDKLEK